MDDEWEFLRKPADTQDIKKKPKTLDVNVIFGGTEKIYSLMENETFETIYASYENRFNMSLVLEHNGMPLSRYAKASVLSAQESMPVLKVVLPKEAAKPKEVIKYYVQYGRYEKIEIERKEEETVKDLLINTKALLSSLPNIETAHFEFDGDVLEDSQLLDDVLQADDLIDLVRD
ncbi:hypothetical protein NERG_01785 [Nematocida ausubeli]|uniref:Ubiquitin-like domain-containing protein n=1 Tax=Nematocida ausubeli (strain ATCC PRA-371 / ERTm2) TaxID=1913371 RepID=H8ZDW4_NEMA1|nr:hypothetical protein NERG_01785 [Nematocida ausubeli]